ncbi:MAG TPA: hypothetical protein VIM59_04575 [Cellvibrio sp.]
MRTIEIEKIGKDLTALINEENPIDDDIGVINQQGDLVGVLISPQAYEFFLEKVEEEEDRIDRETVAEFHKSGEKDQ